jgi:predicted methyltransferase MtxX (methanogen marker protein 4)
VSASKQGRNPGPGPRAPLPAAELAEVRRAQIALTARIDAAAQAFVAQGERIDRVRAEVQAVAARGLELVERIERLECQRVDLDRRAALQAERMDAALAEIERLRERVAALEAADETTLAPARLGAEGQGA